MYTVCTSLTVALLALLLCCACWPTAASSQVVLATGGQLGTGDWACISSSPDVKDTYYYAIRLTSVWDVECSRNKDVDAQAYENDECAPFYTTADCNTYIQGKLQGVQHPDKTTTLVCGKPHESIWGAPGYADPTHWCERGFNILLSKKRNSYPTPLLPGGYPACQCSVVPTLTAQKFASSCAAPHLRGPLCSCFCTMTYMVKSIYRFQDLVSEFSLHMTAWSVFRRWYEVASGGLVQLSTPQEDANVLNNIKDMIAAVEQAQANNRHGRLLLVETLGNVLDSKAFLPKSLVKDVLVQDLSGGAYQRSTTTCKPIAKKYKFTGPTYQPLSACQKYTRQGDNGNMYLTIFPNCSVKVEHVYVYDGKTELYQQGTYELFTAISEVPCFGAHFSITDVNKFFITGDQFHEIDSHGKMHVYSTRSTCSHDCIPYICTPTWTTSDWPDCTWALKTYQAKSLIQNKLNQVADTVSTKLAKVYNTLWSEVEEVLKTMRDAEYDELRGGNTNGAGQGARSKKWYTKDDIKGRLKYHGFKALHNGDEQAAGWHADMERITEETATGWKKLIPVQQWQQVRGLLSWPACLFECLGNAGDDVAAWATVPDCQVDCTDTAAFIP